MKYTITEGGRRNTVTLYSMTLPPEVPVFEYRNQLLKQLFLIYERGFCQSEIENLLLQYCSRTNGEIERKIVSHELDTIIRFFKLFSPGNLCHCIIAGRIQWVARFANYDCGNNLDPYLESQKYKIYDVLKRHRSDDHYELFQSRNELHFSRVQQFVRHYSLSDFQFLISVCAESFFSFDHEKRALSRGLEFAIDSIAENYELYIEVVKSYLLADTPYDIYAGSILRNLFKIMTPEEVKPLITAYDYTQKNTWLWLFYVELPEEQVSEKWANDLLSFLQIPCDGFRSSPYRPLSLIEKYQRVNKNIIIDASRIIYDEYKNYPNISRLYFFFTFNARGEDVHFVLDYYEKDMFLLESICLEHLLWYKNEEISEDLLGEIIKKDPAFLNHYIDAGLELEGLSYSFDSPWIHPLRFIWGETDYLKFMDLVFDIIAGKENDYLRNSSSLIKQLLLSEQNNELLCSKQNEWVSHVIEQYSKDEPRLSILFDALADLGTNIRKKALQCFLSLNHDYSIFEHLPLEAASWGGFGSMIPYMQQRVEYLTSILPLMAGLDFLKHRQRVENDIKMWKERIRHEEIRELLESID